MTGFYIFPLYTKYQLMCTANYAGELCEERLSSKTEGKVGDVCNYMHLFHQSVLLVRSLTAKHH